MVSLSLAKPVYFLYNGCMEKTYLNLSLSVALKTELAEVAEKEHRSTNAQIVHFLEQALAAYKKEQPQPRQ
jgi:hypothetical protein